MVVRVGNSEYFRIHIFLGTRRVGTFSALRSSRDLGARLGCFSMSVAELTPRDIGSHGL